jgi:hypothetical protein
MNILFFGVSVSVSTSMGGRLASELAGRVCSQPLVYDVQVLTISISRRSKSVIRTEDGTEGTVARPASLYSPAPHFLSQTHWGLKRGKSSSTSSIK